MGPTTGTNGSIVRPRILPGLILGLAASCAEAALHGRLPATPGGFRVNTRRLLT
jgi:hypothetical protein